MSKAEASSLLPIPMPLRGLNTINPEIPLDSGYARDLTNLVILDGHLWLRPAMVDAATTNAATDIPAWFDHSGGVYYGVESLTGIIRNMSTGANVGTFGGATGTDGNEANHLGTDYLFNMREPRLRDYPFTAWTFTTIGITATAINSGMSYRGRLYVTDGADVEYSDVGQVTGALTGTFPIDDVFASDTVIRMFPLAIVQGNAVETVAVFIGDQGRVLIYSGDYPAATNWRLVGDYQMEAPVGPNGCVSVDGDIFVTTSRYCYWVRDLLGQGSTNAYRQRPSWPIDNLWQLCDWSSGFAAYIDKIGDMQIDAIVCAPNSGGTELANYYATTLDIQLVYFRQYDAWAIWVVPPFEWPIRFINNGWHSGHKDTVIGSMKIAQYEDGNGQDNVAEHEAAVVSSWKTPYMTPFSRFRTKLTGVRPHYRNTLDGKLKTIQAIAEHSDYVFRFGFFDQSTPVTNPGIYTEGTLNEPTVTWDHYTPFSEIGIDGHHLSLCISQQGNDGSTNFQSILSLTALIEPGGVL